MATYETTVAERFERVSLEVNLFKANKYLEKMKEYLKYAEYKITDDVSDIIQLCINNKAQEYSESGLKKIHITDRNNKRAISLDCAVLEYTINTKYCTSEIGDMMLSKMHIKEEIEQLTKIISDSVGNKFSLDIMIKLYDQFGGSGFNSLMNIYDVNQLKIHIIGLSKRMHDLDDKMNELINSTKIRVMFAKPTMTMLGITGNSK